MVGLLHGLFYKPSYSFSLFPSRETVCMARVCCSLICFSTPLLRTVDCVQYNPVLWYRTRDPLCSFLNTTCWFGSTNFAILWPTLLKCVHILLIRWPILLIRIAKMGNCGTHRLECWFCVCVESTDLVNENLRINKSCKSRMLILCLCRINWSGQWKSPNQPIL